MCLWSFTLATPPESTIIARIYCNYEIASTQMVQLFLFIHLKLIPIPAEVISSHADDRNHK